MSDLDRPRCYEPSQDDPAKAYRRAIVRAAAALASLTTPNASMSGRG